MTGSEHLQTVSSCGVPVAFNSSYLAYQKCSKEGQPIHQQQGHGHPRLIDACGEQIQACLIQSLRRATTAQIVKEKER